MTALKVPLAGGAPDAAAKPTTESPMVEPPAGDKLVQPHLDRAELARLVETHQAGLWRYLRYLGADQAETDDLIQETFLSVARSRFEQRTEEQTASYLRTAARNQLLMQRRREQRNVTTVQLDAADTVWASAVTDHSGDAFVASLSDCVDQLEGRPKKVIELQYREGASRQEIAEQIDMKPDGVKTLLRRTRQLLRECIERRINADR